jgi:hypothetical protein
MTDEESFAVEICAVMCMTFLIVGLLAGNMFTS